MAPARPLKTPTKQPRHSRSSGVIKKRREPRETKEARERRLALDAALAITKQNRVQSALLRLPGEIRNHIYGDLIEDNVRASFWSSNKGVRRGPNSTWMSTERWTESYGLTRICRDIHAEFGTFLMLMEEMEFLRPVNLYKWAKSASGSAKMGVKSVVLGLSIRNSTPTLRRYMAALRTFPDLKRVTVTNGISRGSRMQQLLADLQEIAAKQGGRWKLVTGE